MFATNCLTTRITAGAGSCSECGNATFGPDFDLCTKCAQKFNKCAKCGGLFTDTHHPQEITVHDEHAVLSISDDRGHFHIHLGVPLQVELPQISGSRWVIQYAYDPRIISPISATPVLSGSDTVIFNFQMVAIGPTTLQFACLDEQQDSKVALECNNPIIFFIEVIDPEADQMDEMTVLQQGTQGEHSICPPRRNSIAAYCRALATRTLVEGATCPDLVMPEEPADLAAQWKPLFEQRFIPRIIAYAKSNNYSCQCSLRDGPESTPDVREYLDRVFRFNGFAAHAVATGDRITVEW